MRKRLLPYIIIALLAGTTACRKADINLSPGNSELVKELLTKLDSTDVYAARADRKIQALKDQLPGDTPQEEYALCMDLAREYANHLVDSSMFFYEKAVQTAGGMADKEKLFGAQMSQANILSNTGFHHEAYEILTSLPRKAMKGQLLVAYYSGWSTLYHGLYTDFNEPEAFREKYREKYNSYRDSLLAVADTSSMVYLRSIEKKEARAGNFAEARRYNALRFARIEDPRSAEYATCLYDRFAISYLYERSITDKDVEDLLQSAILEVENANQDIASLLRVEALLIGFNEMDAAKKVSDYYYSSLLEFGSRKRLLGGVSQTVKINDRNFQSLQRKNRQIKETLVAISLLLVILAFTLVGINNSRMKITRLTENLKRSDDITKRYVGVMFQLYSSYIKRLDVFRTRIHSNLKRGHVEQALEATSPSGEIAAEERKELFHNFDTAFVDIFPDYIQTVNACLKPEEQIDPKKTEILTTELRILALIKLGIEDSTQIAEMMHCSVKTVYNLRSRLKSRLAIPEDEFNKIIANL